MTREPIAVWTPPWDVPAGVNALTTLRRGGVSRPPYDTLNLADHVGDDPHAVRQNRRRLRSALALPAEPVWLRQRHGARIVDAGGAVAGGAVADASFTRRAGVVCAALTADCVPAFVCDIETPAVAIVHVGWRGLAGGVVEAALAALGARPQALRVCLGPAIGGQAYEVGDEVYRALVGDGAETSLARPSPRAGHWFVDLPGLAGARFAAAGVRSVVVPENGTCTLTHAEDFFSYRRERECGRMASLIWMEQ